ncbi:MAG TPA: FtsW/RodA/SpoVE family cell cycle protein, partial [Bryobacteraceae bacterium]|nr:FtsW/RodA/SpoVE family cell cycle protein [Bryobacteraceae bacterium]
MAQRVKTDSVLFLTVLGLVAGGMIMLASASSVVSANRYGFSGYLTLRQFGWALAAVAAMMFFKKLDYRRLNTRTVAFSAIAVVLGLLMLVYFLDPRWHRWIRLGPIGIQPSEFAKPALILFLAHFVARRAAAINDRRTLLCGAIIVGLVAGGVMIADLGTAVVLALTGAVVFFVAGLEWRYAAVAGAVLLVFVSIAILTRPYRIARIFSYIDSDYSTLDSAVARHFDPDGRLKAWLMRAAPTR